jgi:hypothetical protein
MRKYGLPSIESAFRPPFCKTGGMPSRTRYGDGTFEAPAMFVVANFGYGGEGPVSQQGPALPACTRASRRRPVATGTVFYVNRNGSRSRGGFVPDLLCGRHGLWMDRGNDGVGRRRKKPQNSCSPSTGALSGATLIRFRFLV